MKDESFAAVFAPEGMPPPQKPPAKGARGGAVLLPPDIGDDGAFADKTQFAANGTDMRRLRDLLRQKPDASLDLHGMTAAEAHSALEVFLQTQTANGRRHLEIVHGRGGHSADGRAVLRAKTRKWLAGCGAVLGFAEVPRNPGASRVLLRRARR